MWCAYPSWTCERVARVVIVTARRIAARQKRDDCCGQLLPLHTRVRSTLLVIPEHVYVLYTILQRPVTPFDLVEEQLALQAASNLERSTAVVGRDAVCQEEFSLDLRLNC